MSNSLIEALFDEQKYQFLKETLPSWLFDHFKRVALQYIHDWLSGKRDEKEVRIALETLVSYHQTLALILKSEV